MENALRVALVSGLALASLGCATDPYVAPVRGEDRSWSVVRDAAHATARRYPAPKGASCPLAWQPREVGSTLRVPAEVMAQPMRLVVEAACRCVRPGEDSRVVAEIDFSAGRVVAHAPDAPDVSHCLDRVPLPAFEPWTAGGGSDCVDCGPRRFGVFRGAASVEAEADEQRLRVTYPVRVNRTAERR